MIGSTPLLLTFIGIIVDWPPYILRPLTCFAYCTGILRSDESINTISANTTIKIATKIRMFQSWSMSELNTPWNAFNSAEPALDRIPTKMSSDTPLPIPWSVIFSPSQRVNIPPPIRIKQIMVGTIHTGVPSPNKSRLITQLSPPSP